MLLTLLCPPLLGKERGAGGEVTAINLFALKLLLIIAKIEIKFPEKSIKIYNI